MSKANRILDFKIERTLTKNKFGITYQSLDTQNNKKVVIKKLYAAPTSNTLSILEQINHIKNDCFVKSRYFSSNNKHYIIRDFIDGTDFKSILSSPIKFSQLSNEFVIQCLIQVLNQLHHLHSEGILHTDIKPSNLLIKHKHGEKISNWNPENIRIIDYERAISLKPPLSKEYKGFSMIYSPPEQILKRVDLFNESIDIFASIVTFLEILSKQKPLYDCNAEIMINLQLTYPIPKPRKVDQGLFDILSPAIYKERFKRPPRQLTYEEITNTLKAGINQREYNSEMLINNLTSWLKKHHKQENHWIIKLLNRIFIEKQ